MKVKLPLKPTYHIIIYDVFLHPISCASNLSLSIYSSDSWSKGFLPHKSSDRAEAFKIKNERILKHNENMDLIPRPEGQHYSVLSNIITKGLQPVESDHVYHDW